MTVDRAERSVLATPGSNPRMIAKALASDADTVMIDLEDAVAPDAKAAARATVAEALLEGDWRGRPRTFRMNALDTHWFVRDLVDVIESAEGGVDLIVVPKVDRPEAVLTVATILESLESAVEARHPIGLETQIESAAGLAQCEAIAAASPAGRGAGLSVPEITRRRSACHWRRSACRIGGTPTIPVIAGTTRCSGSWWRRVPPGYAP